MEAVTWGFENLLGIGDVMGEPGYFVCIEPSA